MTASPLHADMSEWMVLSRCFCAGGCACNQDSLGSHILIANPYPPLGVYATSTLWPISFQLLTGNPLSSIIYFFLPFRLFLLRLLLLLLLLLRLFCLLDSGLGIPLVTMLDTVRVVVTTLVLGSLSSGSNLPDVHIYRLSRHSSSIFTGF